MNKIGKTQNGFTLIEITIVLVIVSILLGYAVALFPVQQELKQYRHVESEMNLIRPPAMPRYQ
jgi:prepilin-type N-terminal cleavage/methylation domain-containing protein